MQPIRALIVPLGEGGYPDNTLPGGGFGGAPDNSLPGGPPAHPWFPGHGGGDKPDQGLPGYSGGHPSTGPVVPPHGPWPGFPVAPWRPVFPTPPIVIPPDAVAPGVPSLPIALPPSTWPPLPWPPIPVTPVTPEHPIVLPPLPEGRATLAMVIPLPQTGADNTLPGTPPPMPTPQGVPAGARAAILYFGPGTKPTVAWIAPPAGPK